MLWSTCKFSFQFSQVYFMRITWWDYFKCPNSWALTKETGYYVETEYFCYIKYDGNQFPQAEYQVAKELSLPDPWRGRWVQLTSIRGWTPTIKTSDRYPMLLIWDTHFDWMIMLTLIFPDQTSTLPLSLYTKYTHWILFLSHGGSNTTVYHMFIWILGLCFVFASSLDIRSCVWVKYNFADLELYHIYWILGLVSWEGQLQLCGFGIVSYFHIGY